MRFYTALLIVSTWARPIIEAACLPPEEYAILNFIKPLAFGGLTAGRAQLIQAGLVDPLMVYDWNEAHLVNWLIIPGKVAALESFLGLPADTRLVKRRIVEDDSKQAYILSLVAKKVPVVLIESVGTTTEMTIQLDWITYVQKEGEDKPRLLVVESIRNFGDISPVPPFVLPVSETVQLDAAGDDNQVTISLMEEGTEVFFTWDKSNADQQGLHKDFIDSFGQLCWPNNVCSTIYSNGLFSTAQVLVSGRKDKRRWKVKETTQWSPFIQPVPLHVVSLPYVPLGLKVWPNAQGDARDLRNQVFSSRTFAELGEIQTSQRESSLLFTVAGSIDIPTYLINFRIPDEQLDALAAAIPLPDGFSLAKVRMRSSGPEEFIITNNVYLVEGLGPTPSFRAEWSVFVTQDGSDDVRFFVIDTATEEPSADPASPQGTPPAFIFAHEVVDGEVRTSIVTVANEQFDVTFPNPDRCPIDFDETDDSCDTTDPKFLRANDEIFWRNGIYDRALYGQSVTCEPISVVDPSSVVINDTTKWAAFVDPQPIELLVFLNRQEYFLAPWFNAEEISVCAP